MLKPAKEHMNIMGRKMKDLTKNQMEFLDVKMQYL